MLSAISWLPSPGYSKRQRRLCLRRLITFAHGRSKPGDLPVQFAIKYEITINVKTTKALALDPPSLLAPVDEMIE
jgi:hypothetical protein